MEEKNIRLFLISGFLGAGKTTFLQKLLNDFDGQRVGVLVNEFGSISVDGAVLQRNGIKLIEINNGSIFCACLKADFVKTLSEMSALPIDVLFIESSGLADPSNMQTLLKEIAPYTKQQLSYQGTICIVDCETFIEYCDILPPIENQVRSANIVLINKTDLVGLERREQIRDLIHKINPESFIYETTYSEFPSDLFMEKISPTKFVGESSNKDWNRPAMYKLMSDRSTSQEKLNLFVRSMLTKAVRVKGFLSADSGGFFHVDAAADQIKISQISTIEDGKNALIIIGKSRERFKPFVLSEWEKVFGFDSKVSSE